MNSVNQLLRFIVLVLCSYTYSVAAESWRKIEVPNTTMTVIDDNGQAKSIKPGCAFSYLPDEAGVPNQPFHFYFRKGVRKEKNKTLIYFNGGGACWNGATCLTSLGVGERPVYNPAIEQENSPEVVGGIMELMRRDNPVRDWNIVFIPYCTGDVHIGSRDMLYRDPLGFVNSGNPVMVQHRGFDNFMAVREWMRQNLDRKNTERVLIAGSSAGSYGALLHFPRLYRLFPQRTKISLLGDAGAGVFTQGFIDLIFAPGGPWGVENTLTSVTPRIDQLSSFNVKTFYQEILTGMASYFHKSQFAQYTTAWDGIQVSFLNIMQKTDAGSINPYEWSNISPAVWLEWHIRMRASFGLMALNRNVNYYIGAGVFHTGLVDSFNPIPDYFYLERSAGNIFLTDWVEHLNTNGRNHKLPSLICQGDCGSPFVNDINTASTSVTMCLPE